MTLQFRPRRPFLRNLKIFSQTDFPPYLSKLNMLYDDLFSSGKGFRSKLIQIVSTPLGLPENHVHLLAQTIEFIHNSSLLHDDLVDRSLLRRSKPAAWLKYSPEYAVLAGDYLLARVMVNLSRHGNLQLIRYTAEIISDLLEGEWIQDSLLKDWNVGLGQLDQVHDLKTASLFKWCLRAPFICAEMYDESLHQLLKEMGAILGLLFQRSDDLLDFNIRNLEGKAVLGDLKSGYFNSFAAFLVHGISREKKLSLTQCQTIEEVKDIVGHEYFSERVQSFDDLNQRHVDLFLHHCEFLNHLLPEACRSLVVELKRLPKPLYWRDTGRA